MDRLIFESAALEANAALESKRALTIGDLFASTRLKYPKATSERVATAVLRALLTVAVFRRLRPGEKLELHRGRVRVGFVEAENN
jgi:hypothetical protein